MVVAARGRAEAAGRAAAAAGVFAHCCLLASRGRSARLSETPAAPPRKVFTTFDRRIASTAGPRPCLAWGLARGPTAGPPGAGRTPQRSRGPPRPVRGPSPPQARQAYV